MAGDELDVRKKHQRSPEDGIEEDPKRRKHGHRRSSHRHHHHHHHRRHRSSKHDRETKKEEEEEVDLATHNSLPLVSNSNHQPNEDDKEEGEILDEEDLGGADAYLEKKKPDSDVESGEIEPDEVLDKSNHINLGSSLNRPVEDDKIARNGTLCASNNTDIGPHENITIDNEADTPQESNGEGTAYESIKSRERKVKKRRGESSPSPSCVNGDIDDKSHVGDKRKHGRSSRSAKKGSEKEKNHKDVETDVSIRHGRSRSPVGREDIDSKRHKKVDHRYTTSYHARGAEESNKSMSPEISGNKHNSSTLSPSFDKYRDEGQTRNPARPDNEREREVTASTDRVKPFLQEKAKNDSDLENAGLYSREDSLSNYSRQSRREERHGSLDTRVGDKDRERHGSRDIRDRERHGSRDIRERERHGSRDIRERGRDRHGSRDIRERHSSRDIQERERRGSREIRERERHPSLDIREGDRERERGGSRDIRERERHSSRDLRDRERHGSRDIRERDIERGRDRDRGREREREKDAERVRDNDINRDNDRDKHRGRNRGRDWDREREKDMESNRGRHKDYKRPEYDYSERRRERTNTKGSENTPSYIHDDLEADKESSQRDADEQDDYEERVALKLAEQEEEDIEKIKEESRKRRQAILEKFKQIESQQKVESPSEKEQKVRVTEDKSVAKSPLSKVVGSVIPEGLGAKNDGSDVDVVDGIFSVGKSPQQNGTSASKSTQGAGGLGDGTPKGERSADMFCDDIFGESPAGVRKTGKGDTLQVERNGVNDNWDDAEGYYSYRFGEILDGRYEVIAAHGKGVFSTVVRAKDLKAGKDDPEEVAIKIIRNNDTMYKAGQEELVILKKLAGADPEDRRHCVRFLSSFKYRNHLCLVFESLHMNLREVLKKFGRNIGLKLTAVRAYAKQLFIALKHLRNCGVLHCDIKPDNMLVNEAKNLLKLCDFGNAMFAGKNEITPYLVSRFYRAPEIILGLTYDHPLDIWSVGCCLYELYSGKVLFPGPSNNDMLRLHMELKGPFPKKMLRKGGFSGQHFDQDMNFHATEEDPVTKKTINRLILNIKPKDMSNMLASSPGEDPKMVANFKDLLDRIFVLDPEKRMTVSQALSHPFITGK